MRCVKELRKYSAPKTMVQQAPLTLWSDLFQTEIKAIHPNNDVDHAVAVCGLVEIQRDVPSINVHSEKEDLDFLKKGFGM
ncbi:hypothetical protein CEXT_484131 [Caerostris extrusa]|uniref:Uncharacterized protein n=1 Tax=Caerostris extrusa TaxID=172846 RepID=A0AAV4PJ06_CAEEX|nr:hypothetical protein CEXT_484131 [Caerostris extrusa]